MKKLVYLLPVISLVMTACGGSSDNPNDMIDYYPVTESSDGKWGFVDKNGEVLISEEFKNDPSPVVNGYFTVREGDYEVLYKAGKKPEIVKGCDELISAGIFSEGVIPVSKKGERVSLVDGSGKTVGTFNPVGGKEITRVLNMAYDGLFVFQTEDHKFGYANTKGEVVIDPKFDMAAPFYDGLAIAAKVKDDNSKMYVINKKGEEVFSIKDDYNIPYQTYGFKDGYLLVYERSGGSNRYIFMDKKGETYKLPAKVEGVSDYNSKYIIATQEDSYKAEYGIMKFDLDNPEFLVRPKYSSIFILDGNKFLVQDDDEFMVINEKGEKQFEFDDDYKLVTPFKGNKAKFVGYDGKYFILLDEKGKPVNKNEFTNLVASVSMDEVNSDYFSAESFVQAMLEDVTPTGIGSYTLGTPASRLGLSAETYCWRSSFTNDELDKEGYRFSITFHGECNESIGQRDYSSYNYYYGYASYEFNPDSKLIAVGYSGNIPDSDYWSDIKPKLVEGLKSKGFKVEKETEDVIGFKSSQSGAAVVKNGSEIVLVVCDFNTLSNFVSGIDTPELEEIEAVVDSPYDIDSVASDTVVAVAAEAAPAY